MRSFCAGMQDGVVFEFERIPFFSRPRAMTYGQSSSDCYPISYMALTLADEFVEHVRQRLLRCAPQHGEWVLQNWYVTISGLTLDGEQPTLHLGMAEELPGCMTQSAGFI